MLAGLVLAGAALARETALIVVAAIAITRLIEIVPHHGRVGTVDFAWAFPALVFAGWQSLCYAVYGTLPLTGEGVNASTPLLGAIKAVSGWLTHPQLTNLLELIQVAVLAVIVILAFLHLRRSRSSLFERIAFVFSVVLLAVLSSSIWNKDPREFRTMVDVFVLGSGVLLGSRSFRPLFITGMTWCVWLIVALVSVNFI